MYLLYLLGLGTLLMYQPSEFKCIFIFRNPRVVVVGPSPRCLYDSPKYVYRDNVARGAVVNWAGSSS